MYQHAICIYISWYSKIYQYPVNKCWCQQNSRGVSRGSYIFWIFFRLGIYVSSFIIVGYVLLILERGGAFWALPFPHPHPWAAPKKPILNRVSRVKKVEYLNMSHVSQDSYYCWNISELFSSTENRLQKYLFHFFFQPWLSKCFFLMRSFTP